MQVGAFTVLHEPKLWPRATIVWLEPGFTAPQRVHSVRRSPAEVQVGCLLTTGVESHAWSVVGTERDSSNQHRVQERFCSPATEQVGLFRMVQSPH